MRAPPRPIPSRMDPNFRVGYAQTWQVSIQRDLPWALQMTATYLGVKGTHGVQEFLPNSYPLGAADPCPDCPLDLYIELRAATQRANPARSNCAADCAPGSLLRCSTPIRNRLTMTQCSADRDISRAHRKADFSSGSSASTSARAADRAGLARPEGRAIAVLLRSAASAQPAGAVHHRPGTGRRNTTGRLARPRS